MRFTATKRRSDESIVLPLVALLDVIFFLLFYFMAAGTLTPPENELPATLATEQVGAGSSSSDFTSQVIYVERASTGAAGRVQYRIGQRTMSTRSELDAILSSLPKPPGIVIRAANDVTVAAVAEALDAARLGGFSKISYVSGR